jgi:hypothetical protein
MHIASNTPPALPIDVPARIQAVAKQLADAAPGMRVGATTLRSADLGGEDWLDQFKLATAKSSAEWKDSYAALTQAKAAVAQLGDSPLAISARDAVAALATYVGRSFDSVARGYMQFWANPTQSVGIGTLSGVANVADRIAERYDATAAALLAIVQPPTAP